MSVIEKSISSKREIKPDIVDEIRNNLAFSDLSDNAILEIVVSRYPALDIKQNDIKAILEGDSNFPIETLVAILISVRGKVHTKPANDEKDFFEMGEDGKLENEDDEYLDEEDDGSNSDDENFNVDVKKEKNNKVIPYEEIGMIISSITIVGFSFLKVYIDFLK